jgi:hypothetical protein
MSRHMPHSSTQVLEITHRSICIPPRLPAAPDGRHHSPMWSSIASKAPSVPSSLRRTRG